MEQDGMSVLIGLDFLRRYQCIIDLHRNALVMTFENTQVALPFLSEHEIETSIGSGEASPRPEGMSPRSSSSAAAVPVSSPATTAASTSGPTPVPASTSSSTFAADVETLVQMGFSRRQAEEALRMLGSVAAAVDFLSN
jgi:DNA damage-inducible protein 1